MDHDTKPGTQGSGAPDESPVVLVYDGDCGFCMRSALWLTAKGDAVARAAHTMDLSPADDARTRDAAGWMVEEEFRAWGAPAIAAALHRRGGGARFLGTLLTLPLVDAAANRVYAWVARHRHRMPGGTSQCRVGPAAQRPRGQRLVALVIVAQVLVPALALTHPPSRFGFQMFSGIGAIDIVVLDAVGDPVPVDNTLFVRPVRSDLRYASSLPKFLCLRIPHASTVTVQDASDRRTVSC